MRPDLPAVRDLLLLSEVFSQVFPGMNEPISQLSNIIHSHHFLSFYKGVTSDI